MNPKQRYEAQKRAYKDGDMAEVQRLAQAARDLLAEERMSGSWEDAKRTLDEMSFPNVVPTDPNVTEYSGEFHLRGKHPLMSYRAILDPVLGFECEGKWSLCRECAVNQLRNQYLIIYHTDRPACYIKHFYYHGKAVDHTLEEVERIFSV